MERPRGVERTTTIAAWILAGAVAAIVCAIDRPPPLLVAAPACPGVLESGVAILTRLRPHTPVADIFATLDLLLNLIAIACVTRLAIAMSRSLAGGAAIGLACARLFAFTPVFAVSDGAAIAAAAFTVLAWRRAGAAAGVSRRIVPWIGVAASVAIAGLVPGADCFEAPANLTTASARLWGGLHVATASISPLVVGLVIFGVFVTVTDRAALAPMRARVLFVGALTSLVAAAWSIAPAARVLAPVVVAGVVLAAIGLGALLRDPSTSPTLARRAASGALLLAVAFVHLPPSVAGPLAVAPDALGLDHLSRESFAALRHALPSGSALVDDDAMVRVLAHDADVGADALVTNTPDHLRQALARTAVFALPPAQLALTHEGFILEHFDTNAAGIDGLARVTPGGECATIRGPWREAVGLVGATSVSLVAPTPEARGPILAYMSSRLPFAPAPFDWPAPARRGWYATAYDRAQPDSARALAADLASDQVPASAQDSAAPYVVRLELWRVPDAPLILDVGLGAPATAAFVHASNAGGDVHVLLCPSRAFAVMPLRLAR